MTGARLTVVSVTLGLEQGGKLSEASASAAFDQVRTQDAARTVGRVIGEALADNLCRRLQAGEVLA